MIKGRRLACALVGALAFAGAAPAADLPVPVAPLAPDWSGPYAGVHVGGGTGTDHDDLTPFPAGATADTFTLSGLIGGVYGGMNWQQGQFVYGLDGALDLTSLAGSHDFDVFSGLVTGTMKLNTDLQGSLKARVGVLVTDRVLLYGAAGLAAAHATVSVSGFDDSIPAPFSATQSQVHIGGVVGLGAEVALTDQLVARGEVDYTSFGAQTYNFGLDQFSPTSVRWDQVTGTVGLGIRF